MSAISETVLILFAARPILAAVPLSPTNIFAPASTPAQTIQGLSLLVLAVTGAIFLTVFSPKSTAALKSNWHGR